MAPDDRVITALQCNVLMPENKTSLTFKAPFNIQIFFKFFSRKWGLPVYVILILRSLTGWGEGGIE